VGCCLGGCFRLIAFTFWRAIFAALLAILLTRLDNYVEGSGRSETPIGRAWRLYRSRSGKTVRRGTPHDAGAAIDTEGRPRS
jgi:hypothetical protein